MLQNFCVIMLLCWKTSWPNNKNSVTTWACWTSSRKLVPIISSHKSWKSKNINFSRFMWLYGSAASHCKWRGHLLNLPYDLKWAPHWGCMKIYWWKLLTLFHYPGKSFKHRHCDSGDIVFLTWHITPSDCMGEIPLWRVTIFLFFVAIRLVQVKIWST